MGKQIGFEEESLSQYANIFHITVFRLMMCMFSVCERDNQDTPTACIIMKEKNMETTPLIIQLPVLASTSRNRLSSRPSPKCVEQCGNPSGPEIHRKYHRAQHEI